MTDKKNLVPARYIGNHAVELGPGKIYYNIDGTRRRSNTLEVGDTMLMEAEDVYGKTIWHDPHHTLPSLYIGIGHVIPPEHGGKSRQELGLLGFEFHEGRSDFIPLETLDHSIESPQLIANSMMLTDVDVKIGEPIEKAESENS